jgi:hypothetical protein
MDELERIEKIFRCSSISGELFDAFQEALKCRIKNLETFKILLANPSLTPDEIKMFTEKIIIELPSKAYDINLWTGNIFENMILEYERLEDCLDYYERAYFHMPIAHEPLLKLLNLYNYELDYPTNKKIIDFIEKGIHSVKLKSKIYFALANHFRHIGNNYLEVENLLLAEKEAEKEK